MKTLASLVHGRHVFTLQQDRTVREAARYMASKGIGAVPVMDGERLVGVFSERDLMSRVVAPGLDPARTPVRDVMTRDMVVAEATEAYDAALERMKRANIRHLPVIAGGRLVGFVSLRDLLLQEVEVKDTALKRAHTDVRFTGPTAIGITIVWKCHGCGHHHPGGEPPDRCPSCGAAREDFELVEED